MYDTKTFYITVQGIGKVPIQACTKWQAIDIAYTRYQDLQPDRKRYK